MQNKNIFTQATPDTTVNPNFNGKKLSFSEDATDHLRRVLTSQYSQADVAVLRELLSNAVDSTVKAGSTRPIEVDLPRSSDGDKNLMVLRVKDYGTGMSYEEIDTIYSNYGSSNKRNDNLTNGSYGLGGKSPLAICDRYDVVSVKDGKKIEFHMGQIDENDKTGAFSIVYDNITETTEPNGVTVTVPYKNIISNTHLLNLVLAGVDNLIVNGEPYTRTIHNTELFTPITGILETPVVFYSNPTNPVSNISKSNLNIILGSVIYPLDVEKIRSQSVSRYYADDFTEETKTWFQKVTPFLLNLAKTEKLHSFYFKLPLGSITPIPSREDIFYDTETLDSLYYHMAQSLDFLYDYLRTELENRPTYKDAYEWITEWKNIFDIFTDKNITWHGNVYNPVFEAKNFTHAYMVSTVYERNRGYKSTYTKLFRSFSTEFQKLNPAKNLIVKLPNDSEKAFILVNRIKNRVKVLQSGNNAYRFENIYLLPEEAFNNPWWNFSPAYNSELGTAEELYNLILKVAREKRAATAAMGGEKILPYKVVKFITDATTKKYNHMLTTITRTDERLKKPLLYVTAGNKITKATNVESNYSQSFWEAVDQTIGLGKYTILVKTPQQKLSVLQKTFPNIKPLDEEITARWVELAKKETVNLPKPVLTWKVFTTNYDHHPKSPVGSYGLSKILDSYSRLRKQNLIPEIPYFGALVTVYANRYTMGEKVKTPVVTKYLDTFYYSHPEVVQLRKMLTTSQETETYISNVIQVLKNLPLTFTMLGKENIFDLTPEHFAVFNNMVEQELALYRKETTH